MGGTALAQHEHDHGHDPDTHPAEALRDGHVDLLVLYEETEGLHMALAAGHHHDHGDDDGHGHDHDHDHLELAGTEIIAGPAVVTTTRSGESWAFQGGEGRFLYVLPQSQLHGVPFLGINTEELVAGDFQNAPRIRLLETHGPGDFSLYQTDGFGQPTVYMNSADAGEDLYAPPVGTHVHMNWAFTQPGHYELHFEMEATLAGGAEITSDPQVVEFHVTGSAHYLREGHAVIGLGYEPDHGVSVHVTGEDAHNHEEENGHEHGDGHDHGHGESRHPSEVVFLLGGEAVAMVPDDPEFAFLGSGGDLIFLSPETEMDGVPYIGWDADGIDPALLDGDPTIELHHVEGPGTVLLYAVDPQGVPTVVWDSADPEEDVMTLPAGSHRHLNFAVTAAGTYELELHAHLPLTGGGETETHAVITLQAGGMEGFHAHFELDFPGWISAEVGGLFYVPHWPWAWNPEQGWLYAMGHGGHTQLYYRHEDGAYLWTSHELFPEYFDFRFGMMRNWRG